LQVVINQNENAINFNFGLNINENFNQLLVFITFKSTCERQAQAQGPGTTWCSHLTANSRGETKTETPTEPSTPIKFNIINHNLLFVLANHCQAKKFNL